MNSVSAPAFLREACASNRRAFQYDERYEPAGREGNSGILDRTPFPARLLILLVRMKGLEPSLPCEN